VSFNLIFTEHESVGTWIDVHTIIAGCTTDICIRHPALERRTPNILAISIGVTHILRKNKYINEKERKNA
jgi:hypothetical protein